MKSALFTIKVPPRKSIREMNMSDVLGVQLSGVKNPVASVLRELHEANVDWTARFAPDTWLERPRGQQ